LCGNQPGLAAGDKPSAWSLRTALAYICASRLSSLGPRLQQWNRTIFGCMRAAYSATTLPLQNNKFFFYFRVDHGIINRTTYGSEVVRVCVDRCIGFLLLISSHPSLRILSNEACYGMPLLRPSFGASDGCVARSVQRSLLVASARMASRLILFIP
jgi:hypothetical protein